MMADFTKRDRTRRRG